ncbi:MAG: cohesin domain-containing protein [Chloroflexota bacterium]
MAFVGAAFLGALALSQAPVAQPTSAVTDPVVSVDAIPDASNTATTVGAIDPCQSTPVGSSFNIDFVIQNVTSISGFQADLLYNPVIVHVTGVAYNFLLASTGVAVVDAGNSIPDSDGTFVMTAVQYPLTPAAGSGVLARVTLQAVSAGASTSLDLANIKLADGLANPIPFSASTTPVYLVPWVVPSGDSDCDGYHQTSFFGARGPESSIGTVATQHCAATSTVNDEPDAWPPDFNDNQLVNGSDWLSFNSRFGSSAAAGPQYDARWDLNASGLINGSDMLQLNPFFGKRCAPP